jgi:hypothetical protein
MRPDPGPIKPIFDIFVAAPGERRSVNGIEAIWRRDPA